MRKSMTIIELLIVVVIIGVLATMATSIFRTSKINSQLRQGEKNLLTLLKAVEQFGYETGTMPAQAQFNHATLESYGTNADNFVNPVSGRNYLYSTNVAQKSYSDYLALGATSNVVVISDSGKPYIIDGKEIGQSIFIGGKIE